MQFKINQITIFKQTIALIKFIWNNKKNWPNNKVWLKICSPKIENSWISFAINLASKKFYWLLELSCIGERKGRHFMVCYWKGIDCFQTLKLLFLLLLFSNSYCTFVVVKLCSPHKNYRIKDRIYVLNINVIQFSLFPIETANNAFDSFILIPFDAWRANIDSRDC